MRIRFGDCVLDSDTRELLRSSVPVHLSPKGFELLGLLLERRPKAVPKAEVHERLWPGTFVSDGTLTSLVAEVRGAIGDTEDSRLIRTVHRFGYAFSGDAESPTADTGGNPRFAYRVFARLGREIALIEGESVVGRDPESAVFLDDVSVSRRHARIRITGDSATIEDLESKNGTSVGERRITAPYPLRDGDAFRVGSVEMTYRLFPLSGSTQTAPPDRRARSRTARR